MGWRVGLRWSSSGGGGVEMSGEGMRRPVFEGDGLQKRPEQSRELASAAEAGVLFRGIYGTTEVVPFPIFLSQPVRSRLSRSLQLLLFRWLVMSVRGAIRF